MAREHEGREEHGAGADDSVDDLAGERAGERAGEGVDEGAGDRVLPDVEDDLDEESYQRLARQRRTRLVRQRVVFAVVVALVLAVGGGAYLVWSDRWQPGGAATPSAAATPSCAPAAPVLLTPGEVTLDVLNGTDRRGLAAAVAGELRTRGFVVGSVGNAPTPTGPGTALVAYPAGAVQQAVTVAARLPEAQLVEDPAATVVTVSLGDGYQALLGEDALVPPVPANAQPAC
ncbi:LytR C-terminal domain-containing protein [Kineococcus sp. SYSU DK002]|uniref:LytR C-terminal domain-containing protein n=1 Tax=Kineococcus sp. SYSU DK002 TaxID=3383123 RepID=UPI003D7CD18E